MDLEMGQEKVLVFDLDETLMNPDAMDENEFEKYQIKDIVEFAKKARKNPDTIVLLLTNNGDIDYIQAFDNWMGDGKPFFHRIWYYYSPNRTRMRSKRLEDVKQMLEELGKSTNNLVDRVFFFDDQPHMMDKELKEGHKINVLPTGNDLSFVLNETVNKNVNMQMGGKRTRRRRAKQRLQKPKQSRKKKSYSKL